MTDLVEFIKARLAEDEALADAADAELGTDWVSRKWMWGYSIDNGRFFNRRGLRLFVRQEPHTRLFNEFSPDRVRRQCQAVREILDSYEIWSDDAQFPDFDGGLCTGFEESLGHLSAIWAHHPDFRSDWDEK